MGSGSTIGRGPDLARLHEAIRRPGAGIVLIVGSGGVGKSHLLEVVAREHEAVWAYGSAAMAGIPLAAVAHLVGPDARSLTAMVADVVGAVPPGGVLVVDDLDQCDPVSLAVARRVARDHERTVVATVRREEGTGGLLPPALHELAHDPATELVEVEPFSRDDTERFVQQLLDDDAGVVDAGVVDAGVVDAGVVEEVWRRTDGNALFITQVVREAQRRGMLVKSPAGWLATGPFGVPARLRGLLLDRVAGLEAELVEAAHFLAAVGRMATTEAGRSGRGPALEALVLAGIVTWDEGGARFVHPLFAEVLWDDVPPLRRRALLREHVALAREAADPDVVRIAVLGLEAGERPDAAGLLAAAHLAMAGGSAQTAVRLAAAAVELGTGDVAAASALVLAAAMTELGRAAEAIEQLRSALARLDPGPMAIALAVTIHKLIVWGTFDLTAAAESLRAEARRYPDGTPLVREAFAIAEADSRMYAGEAIRARDLLARIDLAALPPVLRSLYSTTQAHMLTHLGDTAGALALVQETLDLVLRHPAETIPGTRDRLLVIASHAAREHGSYALAVEYAERSHDGALADGVVVGRAWGAVVASAAWGQVGDLDTAEMWARRALVAASACGMVDAERLAIGVLMIAGGSRGRAVSPDLLERLAGLPRGVGFLHHHMPIAHAWAAYGAGRIGQAREVLREGARAAREADARVTEAWILHDRVRLGDRSGVAGRLAELALDSPLARARGLLVEGLDDADAARVAAASVAFEEAGALLAAAEAAAEAGRLTSGRPAAAARSRARDLAARVGNPTTPMLSGVPDDPLSPRERLVAEYAADGSSNAEIASRLSLSVRTVENHLAHAYEKLGITSRAGLGDALGRPAGEVG